MKITVYYEDNRERTTIEVPDEDCEIWVETDYQRRLAETEDKGSVTRRTPQEIMDEECNKPTYNNEHAETRRHVSLEALDPMGDTITDGRGIEPLDAFDHLHDAIERLTPEQRTLLHRVYWENFKQNEIARAEGVEEPAISKRMSRIYRQIAKHLKNF